MIDSQTYKIRIGCYGQKLDKKNNASKRKTYRKSQHYNVSTKLGLMLLLFLGCSVILLVQNGTKMSQEVSSLQDVCLLSKCIFKFNWLIFNSVIAVDHNFHARYVNGNIQKQKGIINMHINIRS